MVGGPDDKPVFLDPSKAKDMAYVGADDTPVFDRELELEPLPPLDGTLPARGKGPSAGYEERHRAIARLHAYGYTNNQIARHLGYSAPGVSLALQKPWTQEEVARVRTQMVDPDVLGKLKRAGSDAIDYIHRSILDPATKEEIKATNARWTVEKLTGKPKQEVSVESGTIGTFMDMLKDMRERGQVLDQQPIDVTPVDGVSVEDTVKQDKWSNWLDSNLG